MIFAHILDLIYPRTCIHCEQLLLVSEKDLCISCELQLPFTRHHLTALNPSAQRFWGKTPLAGATSLLSFKKGNLTQSILHQIKYKGNRSLAQKFGKLMAKNIFPDGFGGSETIVIPVPLHKRKFKTRGYNQSELLANPIARHLGCELRTDLLYRKHHMDSQTTHTREERSRLLKNVFQCNRAPLREIRNIVLVDDVLTTGSTAEACFNAIMNSIPDKDLYFVSLGMAQ